MFLGNQAGAPGMNAQGNQIGMNGNAVSTNVGQATPQQGATQLGGFFTNPIGAAGQNIQGIGADFTTQNQYQAGLAPTTNYNYGNAIGQSQANSLAGYNTFLQNQAQQQALAGQLQGVASGQGPNPAQAMLQQATNQNVANQAALMASQRGAGANTGLIARQAAQQGAATQQGATSQAAQIQAQQQLGALGQLQGLYGQMGQQNIGEQGANNQLFGAAASANNTQNANNISNYGMMQGINAQIAQNNANAVNNTQSGLLGGIGSAVAMLAKGGETQYMDGGGVASVNVPTISGQLPSGGMFGSGGGSKGGGSSGGGPQSSIGQFFNKGSKDNGSGFTDPSDAANQASANDFVGSLYASKGGKVPVMLSPGEMVLSKGDAKKVASGKQSPAKNAKTVPGKAKVPGDSYANDTFKTKLQPGSVVIPRSKVNDLHKAASFVHAVLAKHGHLPKGK